MHCHLFIPDLFLQWADPNPAESMLRLPALETFLARGTLTISPAAGPEAWLCETFGIPQQSRTDWPVAPLTLLADGGNPGSDYWLRADPVHLRISRDHLILLDSRAFPVSREEAQEFTDALNRHFSGETIIFRAMHEHRWYVQTAARPELQTCGLPDVTGRDITGHLPSGPDAMRWQRIINEAQMVLHGHPLNAKREAAGVAPVNSIWLWGGGTTTEIIKKPYARIWADEPLARGISLASGMDAASLPGNAGQWLMEATDPGRHLVVLESLHGPSLDNDTQEREKALAELEISWFMPLLSALKSARIRHLTLTGSSGENCSTFELNRADLWKVWRGRKPLCFYT